MRKRKLAAPFLVTIAATACNNAPPPSTSAAAPDAGAAPIHADTASASATVAPAPSLPPAPAAGTIERLDGGVCIWHAPPIAPSIRIRNPPAPHQVECPDAGGSTTP
jgi:hypothetical protein